MSNIRVRPETGKLYFDFHYRSKRCREYSTLDDSPNNRQRMEAVLKKIEAEITLGTFEYLRYFPNSKLAAQFPSAAHALANPDATGLSAGLSGIQVPTFRAFVGIWWDENAVSWREGTRDTMKGMVKERLVGYFADRAVSSISKADILQYRSVLAKEPGRGGNKTLSPKTINSTIGTLATILAEAADRYGFPNPAGRIKRLKVPRTDIEPFTLPEVQRLIATVREDYRPYLTIRFFTGMRSGEANGLKWAHIDWTRRQILIRETFTHGRTEYTKNDGSQREINISDEVLRALRQQEKLSKGKSPYVFCNRDGGPIDAKNFADRVWAPLLRLLKLKPRRPYQMRHTCATLWLGAGENPEWIARQLGHTTTEMLFRVYSRYVPNLTRRDGSAFENMLTAALNASATQPDPAKSPSTLEGPSSASEAAHV